MKKINPLLALTGAALALPAIAADQPTSAKLSFTSSTYHEEDIKNSAILSGSGKRYDIEKNQFRLVTPIGVGPFMSLRRQCQVPRPGEPLITLMAMVH